MKKSYSPFWVALGIILFCMIIAILQMLANSAFQARLERMAKQRAMEITNDRAKVKDRN